MYYPSKRLICMGLIFVGIVRCALLRMTFKGRRERDHSDFSLSIQLSMEVVVVLLTSTSRLNHICYEGHFPPFFLLQTLRCNEYTESLFIHTDGCIVSPRRASFERTHEQLGNQRDPDWITKYQSSDIAVTVCSSWNEDYSSAKVMISNCN